MADEREIERTVATTIIPTSRKIPGSTVRYIPSPEEVVKVDWDAYFNEIEAKLKLEQEVSTQEIEESEVIDTSKSETLMDNTVPSLISEEFESLKIELSSEDHIGQSQVESLCGLKVYTAADDEDLDRIVAEFERVIAEEEFEIFRTEEEVESSNSWEDEFAGELDGLPEYVESGEFDPERDLAEIEALLAGRPVGVIESSLDLLALSSPPSVGMLDLTESYEDELENMVQDFELEVTEIVERPYPVLDVGPDSLMSDLQDFSREIFEEVPPRTRPPRKKIKELGDVDDLSSGQTPSVGKVRDEHLPEYLFSINFEPGKFKYWWVDFRESVSSWWSSVGGCLLWVLPFRMEAVLKSIKEKPPN